MVHHAVSLIPHDFQLHTAARIDTHSRCRLRSTTRRSRCSNLPCGKRSLTVMKNLARCGGWTSNPESLNCMPRVPPSRTSWRRSLMAPTPTVGVPFSAGSRHQQILHGGGLHECLQAVGLSTKSDQATETVAD